MPEESPFTTTVTELPDRVGERFGPSSWHVLGQQEVDAYADLTGDRNPIHVDAEYAAASPYGRRIVHGLLTLSMVVPLLREVFSVTDATLRINYGLNRVRFPAPVPAGARVRLVGRVADATPIDGGVQAVLAATFEIEDGGKPACVAELVVRYYA